MSLVSRWYLSVVFFLGQTGGGRIQSCDCGLSDAQVFTWGSMHRHALADSRPEKTSGNVA